MTCSANDPLPNVRSYDDIFSLKDLENRLTSANTWTRIENRKMKHPSLIQPLAGQISSSPGAIRKVDTKPSLALRE